jgi:hypothetical protein
MFIFHKTEIQTVILRCLTSLNFNWYKSYDTEHINTHFANVCFWTKLQKNKNGNICVLCHNFWTNQNLSPLSTSKWPIELQFCERCTYTLQIMAKNGLKTVIYKGTFISNQSLWHFWSIYTLVHNVSSGSKSIVIFDLIKLSSHPCYPRNFDWFLWKWKCWFV